VFLRQTPSTLALEGASHQRRGLAGRSEQHAATENKHGRDSDKSDSSDPGNHRRGHRNAALTMLCIV
jgi:hypothetical protein